MKKLLMVGLGVLLMGMQFNAWAATCATEKKGKGYTLRVLSPGPGTVINKSAPFLLQWQDPAQSMGIKVNVGLHKLKGTKKAPKAIKNLLNQPNTGNVLVTGTNLTQPGKATAKAKFFLRVTSGKTKQFIDSECFTFAPALKGVPKVKAADAQAQAQVQGLHHTVRHLTAHIATLTAELAAVKKKLAAKNTVGGSAGAQGGARGPKGDTGPRGPKGEKGDPGDSGKGGGLSRKQVRKEIDKKISKTGGLTAEAVDARIAAGIYNWHAGAAIHNDITEQLAALTAKMSAMDAFADSGIRPGSVIYKQIADQIEEQLLELLDLHVADFHFTD